MIWINVAFAVVLAVMLYSQIMNVRRHGSGTDNISYAIFHTIWILFWVFITTVRK